MAQRSAVSRKSLSKLIINGQNLPAPAAPSQPKGSKRRRVRDSISTFIKLGRKIENDKGSSGWKRPIISGPIPIDGLELQEFSIASSSSSITSIPIRKQIVPRAVKDDIETPSSPIIKDHIEASFSPDAKDDDIKTNLVPVVENMEAIFHSKKDTRMRLENVLRFIIENKKDTSHAAKENRRWIKAALRPMIRSRRATSHEAKKRRRELKATLRPMVKNKEAASHAAKKSRRQLNALLREDKGKEKEIPLNFVPPPVKKEELPAIVIARAPEPVQAVIPDASPAPLVENQICRGQGVRLLQEKFDVMELVGMMRDKCPTYLLRFWDMLPQHINSPLNQIINTPQQLKRVSKMFRRQPPRSIAHLRNPKVLADRLAVAEAAEAAASVPGKIPPVPREQRYPTKEEIIKGIKNGEEIPEFMTVEVAYEKRYKDAISMLCKELKEISRILVEKEDEIDTFLDTLDVFLDAAGGGEIYHKDDSDGSIYITTDDTDGEAAGAASVKENDKEDDKGSVMKDSSSEDVDYCALYGYIGYDDDLDESLPACDADDEKDEVEEEEEEEEEGEEEGEEEKKEKKENKEEEEHSKKQEHRKISINEPSSSSHMAL